MRRFECSTEQGDKRVALCISRDFISQAGKRNHYKNWNREIRKIVDLASSSENG